MANKPPLLDRFIGYVSPRLAAERMAYREITASYKGGVPTRLSGSVPSSTSRTNTRLPTQVNQRQASDRARNLDRNNVLASAILDRATENVIGTGIQIEPQTDSEDFNKRAAEVWDDWKQRCDLTGRMHYDEMQRSVFRTAMRDGDVGCALINAGGFPRKQIIMGDYLESPPGRYDGGLRVDGVEFDPVGMPVRYWIKTVDEKFKTTYTSIAARDFEFMAHTSDVMQVRGMTRFQQAFDLFDMIMGYLDATVVSARAVAFFSLLIKKHQSPSIFKNLPNTANAAGNNQKKINLEPGSVQYLAPDEDVVQVKPEQPISGFPEAIATFCRFVGLQFGLPIEEVLLDYSRANYTVSRAIKMKIQRVSDVLQQDFAAKFVSRDYQWVISNAINAGEFDGIVIPDKAWRHEWIPQPLPLVDPNKEIQAAREAIALGVETRTNVALGMGYRFKSLCEQNKRDRALMDENDLPIVDGTGNAPAPPPKVDPPDDPKDPPEDDDPQTPKDDQ
jgi:lambda family phage portal protein